MKTEDKKWIIDHLESGWDNFGGHFIPWVAVPNRGGRVWKEIEILEALEYKKEMESGKDE